jgi:curved DNA-binding protein CbpA
LQTLGLKSGREYTAAEIKKSYRKAVMKAHPDAGGTQAKFIAIVEAYERLKNR